MTKNSNKTKVVGKKQLKKNKNPKKNKIEVGRGRPKKNKSRKMVMIQSEDDMSSDENLILKLNVSDSESDTDNKKHTMISLSSKYYSDTDSDESSDSSEDSSENDSSDSSEEEDSKKIIKELKRKIREQEDIINTLKKNINEKKISENSSSGVKEATIIKSVDMNLVDKNSGKIVAIEKTSNPCWWCFHKFNNFPWFLPDYRNGNRYYVFGCFCSVNCASAYNDDMNDSKINIRRALLYEYYREITKTKKG